MESLLVYNIDSELMLKIGINVFKLVLFVTACVFVAVITLRIMLVYKERRRRKFVEMWRPILMQCVMEVPETHPKLNYRFILDFITEWNALFDKLNGTSRDNLVSFASQLKIQQTAIKLLISSHLKIQLTGVVTLGNMQVQGAWPILESIANSNNAILSMAAYRALIMIDSDRALIELLPVLIKREDWPNAMIARILKNTNNNLVCSIVTNACDTANQEQLFRLIQILNALNCPSIPVVFRKALLDDMDDHIISYCLKFTTDPNSIDLVRKYVSYPRWHIRAHAATALGNIGGKEDIKHLVKLIADKQWWVRYRAAQALTKMPFISRDDVHDIKAKQQSKNAKQIIDQVLAELDIQ